MPAAYTDKEFTSCEGELQDVVGVYTSGGQSEFSGLLAHSNHTNAIHQLSLGHSQLWRPRPFPGSHESLHPPIA
jgi:hypothetical protein